jgi:hypothetical protein
VLHVHNAALSQPCTVWHGSHAALSSRPPCLCIQATLQATAQQLPQMHQMHVTAACDVPSGLGMAKGAAGIAARTAASTLSRAWCSWPSRSPRGSST